MIPRARRRFPFRIETASATSPSDRHQPKLAFQVAFDLLIGGYRGLPGKIGGVAQDS